MKPVAALILAAGRGERMNSDLPKVLHKAAGEELLSHVIEAARGAGARRVAVVVNDRKGPLGSFLNHGVESVLQKKRLGTGHAVLQAKRFFESWDGDLLVLPADAPCVQVKTLLDFIENHRKRSVLASVLTAEVDNPTRYGRILREGNQVIGIREELDASRSERKIREVNSGIYLFDARSLFERLREIGKNQKKKEYYLTDAIEAFRRSGDPVDAYRIRDQREILGVNTRRELAVANQILTERELERHSRAGVTILDPSNTYIAKGVRIGRDTVIHPFTWVDRAVVIGRRCEIGPFAKIRSGSKIGDDAVIGSFVEITRSKVGEKTFVKHLSYLGDAQIGKSVNVGAGTITANFDGRRKHKTVVRDRVLLGCDTILVAPVTVGKGARTGAGAVLRARQPIPPGKTAVGVPARVLRKNKKGSKA